MRIGLDFDNTIANYDSAFPRVARSLGASTSAKNKSELKIELLKRPGGDGLWQKIQGLTYGRYIDWAELQPGLMESVYRLRARGNEVFIVSHKTEFGHFDDSKTPLRVAALTWLQNQRIVGAGDLQVRTENVFFLATQAEKVQKINELKLEVFVDDLEEILSHQELSPDVRRILYSTTSASDGKVSTFKSWKEIAATLVGEIDHHDVQLILDERLANFRVLGAKRVDGRGNSKIFRVNTTEGDLALKIYPDLNFDDRPRRKKEWLAVSTMNRFNLQTPQAIETDQSLNWSVFEWIHGTISDPRVSTNILRAADFVRALQEVRASFSNSEEFDFATESCLRPFQVVEQIRARLDALKTVENPALRKFVDKSLVEKLRVSEAHASKILDDSYNRELDFENWTLSPSDFGLHNSITTPHDDLVFIDFEYFGWDDPVKLTADFCLHPAMGLTEHAQRIWLAQMSEIFAHDKYFAVRLGALYPLYAIRWALITLNEFRHDKIKNRRNAQDNIVSDLASVQASQLEKAEQILVKAEKMINDGF